MPPSITTDAFAGRRHALQRHLVCAMQGQFPVLADAGGGALAIAFRAGAGHYGLSGTVATAWSDDGGRTWSDPVEVAPRGDDVRNPALGVLAGGRWVLAYWKASVRCYPAAEDGGERRWRPPPAAEEVTDPALDVPEAFCVTSDDRGRTWSPPRPITSRALAWCSPHGRIVEGPDGALYLAAYGAPRGVKGRYDAIVLRSADGGLTWGEEALACEGGNELSLCWVAPDHLAGAVRIGNGATALVHSRDGGRTWSAPIAATRELEHPGDLCRLRGSGRLLLTFGRRRRPLGCAALTSADGGLTWDAGHEVLLAADGIGNDVGYPSTVQLPDGTLVTALYFARGSAASEPFDGWGETSCQALRYPEALVAPPGAGG